MNLFRNEGATLFESILDFPGINSELNKYGLQSRDAISDVLAIQNALLVKQSLPTIQQWNKIIYGQGLLQRPSFFALNISRELEKVDALKEMFKEQEENIKNSPALGN